LQLNYSGRIRQAFRHADVLIAATSAGQQTIKKHFGRDSYYLSEQGIINAIMLEETKFIHMDKQVQLVWSGTHTDRKNLSMCLDALDKISHCNWMLHVLGSGPLTKQLQQKTDKLELTHNIIWHGHLKRTEAIRIMSGAHLHIITSIAEDNPAVIFEALSYGVPTLSIDHCGMGDVLSERCGIKIQLDEYGAMVKRMAGALNHLILNTHILEALAHTTMKCAANHRWDKRLDLLDKIYNEAIAKHSGNKGSNPAQQTLVA
jgi:glycosyltransferase involved in cell wall biosynthesis